MSKRVLLITSRQPSLNPRLVKEADALADAGYTVTVLYVYWNGWATQFDEQLIATKKWHAKRVGGDPVKRPFLYFFSRLLHKFASIVTTYSRGKYLASYTVARGSFFLLKEARKIKADIYIGHNLGALPATVSAAKAHGKPCGFDAEDFHRFETTDDASSIDSLMKKAVEDRYMPELNYLIASSPIIKNAYQQLYSRLNKEVILNVFPKTLNAQPGESAVRQIKLLWFSQTVGLDRGLGDVIDALALLSHNVFEFHVLGDASSAIKEELAGPYICFHDPMAPDEVIRFATQFDIGLALEKSVPYNRDSCLTNKLFTYAQAGLAVIASDTSAQHQFINGKAINGTLYSNGDVNALAQALQGYANDAQLLDQHKKANYQLGQTTLNWETERRKFLTLVNQTLLGQ